MKKEQPTDEWYSELLEMEAKDKNIDLLRVKINKKENEEKKIY